MPGNQSGVTKEALSRLPELDLRRLRELWCRLYKTAAAPRLSRELIMRAVAYRIQELASGGLRPELQRQLHQIALELQQTGRVVMRPRPQLKPGTRLLREWHCQVGSFGRAVAGCGHDAIAEPVSRLPLPARGHRACGLALSLLQ